MQIPRWVSVKVRAPPVLPLAVSQDTQRPVTSTTVCWRTLDQVRQCDIVFPLQPSAENTRYVVCNRRQKKLEPEEWKMQSIQRGSQFELCFQVQNSEFKEVSRSSLPSACSPGPIGCCGQSLNSREHAAQREDHFLRRRLQSASTPSASTPGAPLTIPGVPLATPGVPPLASLLLIRQALGKVTMVLSASWVVKSIIQSSLVALLLL